MSRARSADPRARSAALALETLASTDPDAIVREVVERLLEVSGAEVACFCRAAEGDERPLVTRYDVVGSERGRRAIHRFASRVPIELLSDTGSSLWDVRCLTRQETQGFVGWDETDPNGAARDSSFFGEYYAPGDLIEQRRLLFVDGDRIAGWVHVFRGRGMPRFTPREVARLAPLIGPLSARVKAVARSDDDSPGLPGDLVLRPDGSVAFASASGRRWLAFRGFADALRARVRAFDRGLELDPLAVLDGAAEARLLRLDGQEGVHYLASVRAPRAIHLSPLMRLTRAERDVAELAAAGASAPEIAAMRGKSAGTVKNQLKRVYRTLGVASRVELALTIERSSEGPST
jgi:DNA-binding CsgD family transcriptional regulator